MKTYTIIFTVLAASLLTFSLFQLDKKTRSPASVKEMVERLDWYSSGAAPKTLDTLPTPLALRKPNTLDFRGIGDSAWMSLSSEDVKGYLSKFDTEKNILIGDISFINWESVLGITCVEKRTSVDFYFLSRPDAVKAAVQFGYNLFGLANNHAQDCNRGKAFNDSKIKHGPLMTEETMNTLYPQGSGILWHGIGENRKEVSQETINIRGENVPVAMMSLAILGWDIPNVSALNFSGKTDSEVLAEAEEYLRAFDNASASLRILSIHTQDTSGNMKEQGRAVKLLKKISELFINKYEGKIVFGHGPHTKGGIKVITDEKAKPKGVIFTSLGNFIHQGLAVHYDNYIARALFDWKNPSKPQLKEIQVFPVKNDKTSGSFYGLGDIQNPEERIEESKHSLSSSDKRPYAPYANFKWKKAIFRGKKTGISEMAGYYAIFE